MASVTETDVNASGVFYQICHSSEVDKLLKSPTDILDAFHLIPHLRQNETMKEIINNVLSVHYNTSEAWELYLEEWLRHENMELNMDKLEQCLLALKLDATVTNLNDLIHEPLEVTPLQEQNSSAEPERYRSTKNNGKWNSKLSKQKGDGSCGSRVKMKWYNVVHSINGVTSLKVLCACALLYVLSFIIFYFTTLWQVAPAKKEIWRGNQEIRSDIAGVKEKLDGILPFGIRTIPKVLPVPQGDPSSSQIVVNSYNEYQQKMRINRGQPGSVNVSIILSNQNDWPDDVPLENPQKIGKLSFQGNISMYKIISILQETTNVKVVSLINSRNELCRVNEHPQMTECRHIYDYLSANVFVSSLRTVVIRNSEVNIINQDQILRFLSSYKNSLQNLEFRGTSWNVVLLNKMPTFPTISSMHIDFLSNIGIEDYITSSRFHDAFTSLHAFSSTLGKLTVEQVRNVLECKTLATLNVRLTVARNVDFVDMKFLRNGYSALKHVDVSLYFPHKRSKDHCGVKGIEIEKRHLNLSVRANCDITEIL